MRRGQRPNALIRLVSLSPFALAIWVALFAQTYSGPLFPGSPEIMGIPFGTVLEGILLVWAAIGEFVIRRSTSRMSTIIGLNLFTAPSIVGILFGPAIIVITQNL